MCDVVEYVEPGILMKLAFILVLAGNVKAEINAIIQANINNYGIELFDDVNIRF